MYVTVLCVCAQEANKELRSKQLESETKAETPTIELFDFKAKFAETKAFAKVMVVVVVLLCSRACVCVCVCMHLCMCVCVCVCMKLLKSVFFMLCSNNKCRGM